MRDANFSNSTFVGADLSGADLRGANVSGSCFVGANLRGASLDSSVNMTGAIFCGTTMPDGTANDSGCERETACCHRRLQDCPDRGIWCVLAEDGVCTPIQQLPPVGTCYHFPTSCCPCEHPDEDYWDDYCNSNVDECAGVKCVAQDFGWLPCYGSCDIGP